MPAVFEDFNLRFMYPENWQVVERLTNEESAGVTLESPGGAFFAVTRYLDRSDASGLLADFEAGMRKEYNEIESAVFAWSDAGADEVACDLHFYCLDLLVISRLTVIPHGSDLVLLQIQGESREFDKQSVVFAAILKTLREHLQQRDRASRD